MSHDQKEAKPNIQNETRKAKFIMYVPVTTTVYFEKASSCSRTVWITEARTELYEMRKPAWTDAVLFSSTPRDASGTSRRFPSVLLAREQP